MTSTTVRCSLSSTSRAASIIIQIELRAELVAVAARSSRKPFYQPTSSPSERPSPYTALHRPCPPLAHRSVQTKRRPPTASPTLAVIADPDRSDHHSLRSACPRLAVSINADDDLYGFRCCRSVSLQSTCYTERQPDLARRSRSRSSSRIEPTFTTTTPTSISRSILGSLPAGSTSVANEQPQRSTRFGIRTRASQLRLRRRVRRFHSTPQCWWPRRLLRSSGNRFVVTVPRSGLSTRLLRTPFSHPTRLGRVPSTRRRGSFLGQPSIDRRFVSSTRLSALTS